MFKPISNSPESLLLLIGNNLSGIKHYARMLTDHPHAADCIDAFRLRIEYQQQEAELHLAELAAILKPVPIGATASNSDRLGFDNGSQ